MTSKSSRDLLVRVRFQNPIPPPPFPPKLFNVSTDIHRLGMASYLDHLSSSTPLPMLVDSEMGMTLDLNQYGSVWTGEDKELNPTSAYAMPHDPTDLLLLTSLKPVNASNQEEKPTPVAEVSWMRNTSLFTRKTGTKKKEAKGISEGPTSIDASEAAQLMTIDKTFADMTEPARHPEKSHLTALETYDLLPDIETWGNNYVMMRFPERPATGALERLSSAIMRPILDDDQQLMEYYLPREADLGQLADSFSSPADPTSVAAMQELSEVDGSDPKIDEVFAHVQFDRIGTYEVVSQDQPQKDVFLVLEEDLTQPNRQKGAYYKTINMKSTLRKTRSTVEAAQRWDRTRIGYRLPDEEPSAARQISDPLWVNEHLRDLNGTNDAEGLGEAIDEDDENE